MEFLQALRGMGESGDFRYLRGFAPVDTAQEFIKISQQENWGIIINDPAEDDLVPTLVRNPKWVSLISPVFKMIEVVPGYRELDISLWFLIFFSVFFGILIGDAAYGLIYFIFTFIAQRKFGRKLPDQSIFMLFYLLSACAVIWGLLSGTFFGQEWLPAAFKPLMPALRDDKNLQALCFFLGALHLSIAHLWRAFRKIPSLTALSEMGWICVLWGAFS